MDLNPLGRVRFVLADLIPDFRVEYFRSPAGHAPKPSFAKIAQDILDTLLGQELKPFDLDGRPAFEVNLRKRSM